MPSQKWITLSAVNAATIFLIVFIFFACSAEKREEKRILIFSKTAGFRHESIQVGKEAILKIAAENNILADTTENAAYFHEDSLKRYSAIIFLNTTGDILDYRQEADFERYIQAGGGFVGIHAATDTEYDWPWYNQLVGAYFNGHPNNPNVREATIDIVDSSHPASSFLPARWERADEWYNFKSINPAINVLAKLDERTYQGGTHGEDEHPIAWYHDYEGGRAFYTGGGHTKESFSEPLFMQHILAGIQYAIGKNFMPDYSKALTERVPEDNRFVQEVLDEFLDEPMELAIMNDNKVLFIERRGKIKIYDPAKRKTKTIATINVHTEGNYEDGLLGLALDPNFKRNRWIYLYYSPAGDIPKQNLSRFYLTANDSLLMRSEKLILEVPVQRETCCHSAGSIEFGPDGVLYLSTGDNTSSKESAGYSPLDEREGRSPYDAQKSSGNTHDLRGKILRIVPRKDGTYTIPDGNLFPKDGSAGRPEIFVMGVRNPFRYSIDAKNKTLYWGDVGPDAGKSSIQGPESFDEFNKTTQPGNFGWPYFQADNKPFPRWDFATETPGPLYDPARLVNNSPNNTGAKELPPAQLPFMWYPYGSSAEFPMLGTGSRSAMAGPVYYDDLYQGDRKFPSYYDGKLFIYEWARSWVKVVSFDKNGDMWKVEPFLPNLEISKPIDMAFGPDGAMYMLQYGANYFTRNPDARLVRIDYTEGNRAPMAKITTSKTVGAAPLTVTFSAESSFDYDSDELRYEWMFAEKNKVASTESSPQYTFQVPGKYQTQLRVTDSRGASSVSKIDIEVGNEPPVVAVEIAGNSSFYWDNRTFAYQVKVEDLEDGTLAGGKIDPSRVSLTFEYLQRGQDLALLEQSSQMGGNTALKHLAGKELIAGSDCKACHAIEKASIGPAYNAIAERYKDDNDAVSFLAQKIVAGGSGNWGKNIMAAHPQHTLEETTQMVAYIMSLVEGDRLILPLAGSFKTSEHVSAGEEGAYYISADYTDNGGNMIGSLYKKVMVKLRHPKVQAEAFDMSNKVGVKHVDGEDKAFVSFIRNGSSIGFRDIDLTDILSLSFKFERVLEGGMIEVRSGSPSGMLLGSLKVGLGADKLLYTLSLAKEPSAKSDLYFLFINQDEPEKALFELNYIQFNPRDNVLNE